MIVSGTRPDNLLPLSFLKKEALRPSRRVFISPDAPPEGGPPPLLRIHDLFTEGSQFVHHLPGTSWYHDRVRCKTRHISSLSLFSKHEMPPGVSRGHFISIARQAHGGSLAQGGRSAQARFSEPGRLFEPRRDRPGRASAGAWARRRVHPAAVSRWAAFRALWRATPRMGAKITATTPLNRDEGTFSSTPSQAPPGVRPLMSRPL